MAEYYIPGGTPAYVRTGQPFAVDGVQYPRKWLALAGAGDFAALGVVARPVPGPDEIVEQGESGWVIRSLDAGEIDDRDAAAEAAAAAAVMAAHAAIDSAAEAARCAVLTPGSGQALEYEATRQEAALAALAADPLDAGDYPMLAAEQQALAAVGVTATLRDVVAQVQGEAAAWAVIGSRIKQVRRAAKLAIDALAQGDTAGAAALVAWASAAYATVLAGGAVPDLPE